MSLGLRRAELARRREGADHTPRVGEGAPAVEVRPVFALPLAEEHRRRDGHRVGQHADRVAAHALADVEEQLELRLGALAVLDLLERAVGPSRPLAARRALAA